MSYLKIQGQFLLGVIENQLILMMHSTFNYWAKLNTLRVDSEFPYHSGSNSGLSPLKTLQITFISDEELVDLLSSTFSRSCTTLKNLELSFHQDLESYDSLNDFLSSCINLESLYLDLNFVAVLQDSVFLNETMPILQNLKKLYLSSSTPPASIDFLYELPNLRLSHTKSFPPKMNLVHC